MYPIYFATVPIEGRKIHLKAGEPFPLQHKGYIRGLGPSVGCPDADTMNFGRLPYVQVIDAGDAEAAQQILELGLSAEQAAKRLTTTPRKAKAA